MDDDNIIFVIASCSRAEKGLGAFVQD